MLTEYDAASPPPAEPGLGLRQLAFDPYLLVIPPDWQITARSLRDLASRPWVAGPPGTACDHALQRLAAEAGIAIPAADVCVEFPSVLALVAAVTAGVLCVRSPGHIKHSARQRGGSACGRRPGNAVEAAEIWSGRPGVFSCPGALGRYLAGTGRQFGADLNGEVQVRLAAGHLLQAFGDERGGLGDVTGSSAWIRLPGMSVACRTVPLHSGG